MRSTHLITFVITLLLSCYHLHIATAKVRVPSDVKVVDEPGEDECDYSFYLWQVLNNEVSDIDYYALLGIDRAAADKDIRRGYRKQTKVWEEWSSACGIRNFEKARGDVMLSDAYSTISNSDTRKRYDTNLKHPATTMDRITSMFANIMKNIGKYWQPALGGLVGLIAIQLLNTKMRTRIWRGLGMQKQHPVISELRLQRLKRLQKNKQ